MKKLNIDQFFEPNSKEYDEILNAWNNNNLLKMLTLLNDYWSVNEINEQQETVDSLLMDNQKLEAENEKLKNKLYTLL